jgi:hypothetical protein
MKFRKIGIDPEIDVLVIEDNCERIDWFRDKLQNINVAKNVREAKEALRDGCPYGIIFLDFDAGWRGQRQETFIPVADRLVELNYHGTVVIHSMDPPGAQRLLQILEGTCDVHVAPFGSFELLRIGHATESDLSDND